MPWVSEDILWHNAFVLKLTGCNGTFELSSMAHAVRFGGSRCFFNVGTTPTNAGSITRLSLSP